MGKGSEPTGLERYLPQAVGATCWVAVLPVLIVSVLERVLGLHSLLLSALAGMALSVSAAAVGNAYWMRRPGARDLVFGDLMVWGYARRLRAEKRLGRITQLLEGSDEVGLSPAVRTGILKELAATLEARDPYTHGHTRRVARHSYMIARAMRLPK
ncbi:MAG: hypothetical protein ACRDJ5_04235, partial [Actinomycetota bacterium]